MQGLIIHFKKNIFQMVDNVIIMCFKIIVTSLVIEISFIKVLLDFYMKFEYYLIIMFIIVVFMVLNFNFIVNYFLKYFNFNLNEYLLIHCNDVKLRGHFKFTLTISYLFFYMGLMSKLYLIFFYLSANLE